MHPGQQGRKKDEDVSIAEGRRNIVLLATQARSPEQIMYVGDAILLVRRRKHCKLTLRLDIGFFLGRLF
jgi:hypothetical protein